MKRYSSKLIDLYRVVTSPIRQWRLKSMINQGTVPVAILFYHRVDDNHFNDWTISETRFLEQIDWYQENFDLVSLAECQSRIRSGHNERPTLSITFDDGYADNCMFAIPLLLERGIPFTYFVTTQHTLQQQAFPHDIELGNPLSTNSPEALKAMAAAGVEIGAHTRTHPDLGKITDPEVLFDEVIVATQELEKLIDQKIKYFAFPYGQVENLNPEVFQLCKQHGFEGVCSAYGGLNFIDGDPFHLQRIHGDPKFSRMKNWLTWDPRFMKPMNYEYENAKSPQSPLIPPVEIPVNMISESKV